MLLSRGCSHPVAWHHLSQQQKSLRDGYRGRVKQKCLLGRSWAAACDTEMQSGQKFGSPVCMFIPRACVLIKNDNHQWWQSIYGVPDTTTLGILCVLSHLIFLRILIDTFPSHIYGWRIYQFLIDTEGHATKSPWSSSLYYIAIQMFNTTGLKDWIVDGQLDRNEKLFLLASMFSCIQKCGGEIEAEITVSFDFPALDIS